MLVTAIYTDLTAQLLDSNNKYDLTLAKKLKENQKISFQRPVKVGTFDISGDIAREWLLLPNPNCRTNRDVIKSWVNGMDIARRPSDKWIIDFSIVMTEMEAALYEIPFQHVLTHVKPTRQSNRMRSREKYWWLHGASAENLRTAVKKLSRFIVTPRAAKYRLFIWLNESVLPDSGVVAIARSDNTTFGILNSRFHELWSLRTCNWLGKGNDPHYTPTTTFETFPFPTGVLTTTNPDAQFPAIAEAAKRLNELRENWLNPPEWIKREPEVVPGYPERIIPKPNHETELKKRTLTNLYNQRPTWLINAHGTLDAAVAMAYGWNNDITDDEVLKMLLELNLERVV